MVSRTSAIPAFILGALAGVVAAEAGMCMADPCIRRRMRRKGRQAMRIAQSIGSKIM